MGKKIISFEITCEGHVVAPITKHYKFMTNTEKIKLKKHLIFMASLIKPISPAMANKK